MKMYVYMCVCDINLLSCGIKATPLILVSFPLFCLFFPTRFRVGGGFHLLLLSITRQSNRLIGALDRCAYERHPDVRWVGADMERVGGAEREMCHWDG